MNSLSTYLIIAALALLTAADTADAQFRFGVGAGRFSFGGGRSRGERSREGRSRSRSNGFRFGFTIPLDGLQRERDYRGQPYRGSTTPAPTPSPRSRPLSAAETKTFAAELVQQLAWQDNYESSTNSDSFDSRRTYATTESAAWKEVQDVLEETLIAQQSEVSGTPSWQANWTNDPPDDFGTTVDQVIEDAAWPETAKQILRTIDFTWFGGIESITLVRKGDLPFARKAERLRELPAAASPPKTMRIKSGFKIEEGLPYLKDILAFELGKLVLSQKLNSEEYSQFIETEYGEDIRELNINVLPHAPWVEDPEDISVASRAYRTYLFNPKRVPPKLRKEFKKAEDAFNSFLGN